MCALFKLSFETLPEKPAVLFDWLSNFCSRITQCNDILEPIRTATGCYSATSCSLAKCHLHPAGGLLWRTTTRKMRHSNGLCLYGLLTERCRKFKIQNKCCVASTSLKTRLSAVVSSSWWCDPSEATGVEKISIVLSSTYCFPHGLIFMFRLFALVKWFLVGTGISV